MTLHGLQEVRLADSDVETEWEAKPSSPESIRLISMGKLLNDKVRLSGEQSIILFVTMQYQLTYLEDSGFTNSSTPHIIHMTIKPQDIVDEEDAKMKAAGSSRGDSERSPGCRCIIQ